MVAADDRNAEQPDTGTPPVSPVSSPEKILPSSKADAGTDGQGIGIPDLNRARVFARTGRREEAIVLCRQWAETCPEASVLLAEILTDPEHHATTLHAPTVRAARRRFRIGALLLLLGITAAGGYIRRTYPPDTVLEGCHLPWISAAGAFGGFVAVCLVLGWYHATVYRVTRWRDLADAPFRAAAGALGDAFLLGLPLLGPWLAPALLWMPNEAGKNTAYGLNKAIWLMLGQTLALAACLGLLT